MESGPLAPLSGWAGALRNLANTVMTRSQAELARLRERIVAELGEGTALVCALAPEWAVILEFDNRQSSDDFEGGLDRLAIAIVGLLRCFSEPDAEIVLVLDDLQWADDSSMRIMELALAMPEPMNLLVLATIRSTPGVVVSSRLERLRERADASAIPTLHLRLLPWNTETLIEFLNDSFSEGIDDIEVVADCISDRTHGNPFFVHALLRSLIERHWLRFDHAKGLWTAQLQSIRALPPAQNVVVFLSSRIAGLPQPLRETLRVAACLGSQFGLDAFTAATRTSEAAARGRLELARHEGFLASHSELGAKGEVFYGFVHDRVLEACHALMTESETRTLHLELGRALLDAFGEPRAATIVTHFNEARAIVVSDSERLTAARLNLVAGQHAQRSVSFGHALRCYQAGIAFLEQIQSGGTNRRTTWHSDRELTRQLHEGAAEAALREARFEDAHYASSQIIANETRALERVKAFDIRVCALAAEKRFSEAVAAGCEVLAELGVHFPRKPITLHAIIAFLWTKRLLFGQAVERLEHLPNNATPRTKAASHIMQSMYSAAYLGHQHLFPLVVCRHIGASLRFGNDDYSCVTYIAFCIVLSAMGRFDEASRLGRVALALLDAGKADRHRAKVLMGYYTFVYPWRHHLRDAIPFHAEGIKAGLEHGDFEYAGHLLTLHTAAKLHTGHRLAELQTEADRHLAKLVSLRQERSILTQELFCQYLRDLRSSTSEHEPLSGPLYRAEEKLAICLSPLDRNLTFVHYFMAGMLHAYLGDRTRGLQALRSALPYYESGGFGIYVGAVFTFWHGLLETWFARSQAKSLWGRTVAARRARSARRKLAGWAKSAPMNFLHKWHLLEAEHRRSRNQAAKAAEHYERAVELAQTHGYVHDAALALELAAEFYLESGMPRLGRHYLREAYGAYERWGAEAVLRRFERQHAQHFAALVSVSAPERAAWSSLAEDMDYRVLIKAFQAISSEVRLPALLERLLRAMFEHAGAQRALLVLERKGQLFVEAEADVDSGEVEFFVQESLVESTRLSPAVTHFVARTQSALVLGNAASDVQFCEDEYIRTRRPNSLLATPITYQGRLLGVAYLENNRVSHVFNHARLGIANLLAAQAGISIASARFHALELEAQQAKINPHLLFNALSSIAELAVEDGQRAEAAILALAKLYRYVLETSNERLVTLNQELEVVRNYLALEKLRYGDKLDYSVTCEPAVGGVGIPGLLIQPLAENAVRHGVSTKLGNGHVWIDASRQGDLCRIVVQDDGDGTRASSSGTGFGLRSVQDRLALVYGENYKFALTQRRGYQVEIHIPLQATALPEFRAPDIVVGLPSAPRC